VAVGLRTTHTLAPRGPGRSPSPSGARENLRDSRSSTRRLDPSHPVSTELLTRAGPRSDFATDTCVCRSGIDPRTGSRYLEELAFERESHRDGRAEGKAEFIMRLLHSRGLPLQDELRARLEQCDDEAQLRRWFDAARAASSAEEVFE